jgi:hypothetical protein
MNKQQSTSSGGNKWWCGTTAARHNSNMGRGLNSIFSDRKPKKAKPAAGTPKVPKAPKGLSCSEEEREHGLLMTKKMMVDISADPKQILGKVSVPLGNLGTDSAKQSTIDHYETYWKTHAVTFVVSWETTNQQQSFAVTTVPVTLFLQASRWQ